MNGENTCKQIRKKQSFMHTGFYILKLQGKLSVCSVIVSGTNYRKFRGVQFQPIFPSRNLWSPNHMCFDGHGYEILWFRGSCREFPVYDFGRSPVVVSGYRPHMSTVTNMCPQRKPEKTASTAIHAPWTYTRGSWDTNQGMRQKVKRNSRECFIHWNEWSKMKYTINPLMLKDLSRNCCLNL